MERVDFVNVFVYGSLKKGFGANHLLDMSEFISTAILYDYALYPVCNWPGIQPMKGKYVKGEVYSVPVDIIPSLDRYEGHPNLFTRTALEVDILLKPTTCIAYVYNGDCSTLEPALSGVWARR